MLVILLSVANSICEIDDSIRKTETQHKAEGFPEYRNDSSLKRQKRSLGLLASLFHRAMFNEVQDYMEEDDNANSVEDDFIELVKCELVLERKICTIREKQSECKNFFGRKCFLYKYPRTTLTVEKGDKFH